jgi:hypothetical protein
MSEIDRIGIEPCMRDAIAHAAGAAFLHLSFDMDVVDPDYAPGVGTPVRGGLSYREAHLAMETVAESGCSTRWTSSRSTRSSIARTRRGSSPSSSWPRRSARASSSAGARDSAGRHRPGRGRRDRECRERPALDGRRRAGALKRAGGDEIEQEAMAIGGIRSVPPWRRRPAGFMHAG